MASAPVAAQDYKVQLPQARPGQGLQVHTIWVARAISMMFMDIKTIGGFRQDALRWHPRGTGHRCDDPQLPLPGGHRAGQPDRRFHIGQRETVGVLHVIWRQGLLSRHRRAPSWTADYGNRNRQPFRPRASPPMAAVTHRT